MPVTTVVYRERLLALGQPGGAVYTHWLRTMMRIDARAKYFLEGVMVNKHTGNLLSSQSAPTVVMAGTQITGTLTNTASYALFVHEGTKPHEILPVRAKFLRFQPSEAVQAAGSGGGRAATGGYVFRRRVMHPGTAPRPFLRRAMEEVVHLA